MLEKAKMITTFLVGFAIFGRFSSCNAYAPISDLTRDDMAGIWRLSSRNSMPPTSKIDRESSHSVLKEFTVFPKRKKKDILGIERNMEKYQEMFIKLLEDGSFVQFGKFDQSDKTVEEDDEEYLDATLFEQNTSSKDKNKRESRSKSANAEDIGSILGLSEVKGTWDYLDGKLILATDRPSNVNSKQAHDTVLEGQVVATSEKSLTENPALSKLNETSSSLEIPSSESSIGNDDEAVDTHLSVPEGSIKIGKFMYPKAHPSFFEQTIFHPKSAGSFELRQVLGNLNTKIVTNEEIIEKYRREDLYGRRFILTSHPLQYQAKGKLRWNRSLGQYVEDKPKIDPNARFDIKAMQIEFFTNNTFSTDGGVSGDFTKVLRGKWSIIGRDRDQLWMQVTRFGFGRSVSGSTYSEGTFLTQNDERSYWGTIHEVIHMKRETSTEESDQISPQTTKEVNEDSIVKKTLEIRGTVLFGWGLEPEPIGKFVMVEQTAENEEDYEDEDDEDYDNDAIQVNYDEARVKNEEDDDENDEPSIFDSVFE